MNEKYWCGECSIDCRSANSTATPDTPVTTAGTWTVSKEGLPEILGRRVTEGGKYAGEIEISCPYCGTLHHHSPEPTPGVRTSHCGLPYLCQTGSYFIKAIYEGPPQPKRQAPDWLNFYGETVKIFK